MSKLLRLLMMSSLIGLMTACGGGGSETTTSASVSRTGTVALTFTDAPSDEFQEINIEVSGISLLGENGHITLFDAATDGGNRVIDLLALQAFSEFFTVEENVPAGVYNKIRLYVDNIELVKKDDDGNTVEIINPDIPANGKIDLNPRGSFVVHPGQLLHVQIDIDADKSFNIHPAGNSGRYKFHPVVFIDIIDDGFSGRLTRIHGTVDTVSNTDSSSFILCPDYYHDDDSRDAEEEDDDRHEHCVRINPDNASFFNEAGLPVEARDYTVGEELTAIGFLTRSDDDDSDEGESGRDNLGRDDSDNDDASHEDDDDDRYEHRTLNAEVIELGPEENFEMIKGKVASEPTSANDQFALSVMSDMPTDIIVQLQAGTRVFSKQGDTLDYSAIQMGRYASVDGVFNTASDEAVLNAALVVVDTDEMPGDDMEKLSGEVLSVDAENSIITISTETGDQQIKVDPDQTHVLLLDDDGNESDDGSLSVAIDLSEIMLGQELEAYGMMGDDGYFHAKVILVGDVDGESEEEVT